MCPAQTFFPSSDLQKYVPAEKLAEARRVLCGQNGGGLVCPLPLPEFVLAAAQVQQLDLQVSSCPVGVSLIS